MIDILTLRDEVRTHMSIDEDDLPAPDVDLLLNRTYWELQEKFHLRQTESSSTIPTVASQRDYDLPASFESLKICSVLDPDSEEHIKLDRIGIKQYEAQYSEDTEAEEMPSAYLRYGSQIRFWPTPDAIYTITLYYLSGLADLATGQDPQLPNSWQELLILGATYRGYLRFNDIDKANGFKAHYINLLNSCIPVEAKEEWDSSRARVLPLGMRDYDTA